MTRSNLSLRIEETNGSHASAEPFPPELTELLQPSSGMSAEARLMAAVLRDAIRSFRKCKDSRGVRSRRLFDETAEWFASDDHGWPFAFENICAVLDVEPDWIRRALRRSQDVSTGQRSPNATRSSRLQIYIGDPPMSALSIDRSQSPSLTDRILDDLVENRFGGLRETIDAELSLGLLEKRLDGWLCNRGVTGP